MEGEKSQKSDAQAPQL